MQETLLDELSTTRRVRMHGQIASVIEQFYGDRASEGAARLAMHFSESATLTKEHAEKAVHYSELAAQQAEARAAWIEAARHFANAITNLSDDTEPARRIALLVGHGRCLATNYESRPAWRSLMEARSLAQRHALPVALAQATLEASRIQAPPARMSEMFEEALDELPAGHHELEFRLLTQLVFWASRSGWNEQLERAGIACAR